MSQDEFDPFEGERHEEVSEPPAPSLDALKSTLVTASSLLDPDDDPDEGDFEPGGLYKGFEILLPEDWPHVPRHAHIKRRFYVRHNDTMGMVPWPGSKIIWPWEAAWEQDLYREEVVSYLKEDEKKGAKRGRAT